jgi:hypothetical protein
VSGDLFNVANAFNKNWGVSKAMGNQALYAVGIPAANGNPAVPAFDQTARKFNYRVNTAGVPNSSGDPYQAQIGVRYSF